MGGGDARHHRHKPGDESLKIIGLIVDGNDHREFGCSYGIAA
jgi:hypothetical protein